MRSCAPLSRFQRACLTDELPISTRSIICRCTASGSVSVVAGRLFRPFSLARCLTFKSRSMRTVQFSYSDPKDGIQRRWNRMPKLKRFFGDVVFIDASIGEEFQSFGYVEKKDGMEGATSIRAPAQCRREDRPEPETSAGLKRIGRTRRRPQPEKPVESGEPSPRRRAVRAG